MQGAQTVLHQGPLVNFSRPSVDVLFHSASRVFGADLLAVVLTGMGRDGCGGCESVVASGGTVLVQDELSSVVWGMPGAVAKSVHDPLAGPPQGVPCDALRMHSRTWPTSCVGAVPLRAARDAARLARTPARHLGVDDLTTRSGPTPLHHGHDKLQPCPR